MKCENCGEVVEESRVDGQSPAHDIRQLCLLCQLQKEDRSYTVLVLSYVGLVVAGLLLLLFLPQLSLGILFLNGCTILAFVFTCTLIHELGHVLAGRSVGFRIFGVEIGWGRVVTEFILWKMQWRFRSVLFGGFVRGVPKDIRHYRLRQTVFVLGGPLANVLFVWLGIELLWVDEIFESGLLHGFIPARMLVLSNAVLLIYSVFPSEGKTQYGDFPNDALLLWRTWRQPKVHFQELPVFYYVYETEDLQRQKQFNEAKCCVEAGLQLFPQSYFLELAAANNLLSARKYSDARRAYVRLLGRYRKQRDVCSLLFNSIAWSNLLSGDSCLLSEADECSRLALEQMPDVAYFKGTRGSVLVELGQYEQGLQLLREAVKNHPEQSGQALELCCMGVGERKRGNAEKSRAYFAFARKLDPNCDLLDRELAAHGVGCAEHHMK